MTEVGQVGQGVCINRLGPFPTSLSIYLENGMQTIADDMNLGGKINHLMKKTQNFKNVLTG